MKIETFDALVIGAGPAGSSAALELAKSGAETLLIDRKARIGEQPHCGEFVSAKLFSEVELNPAFIHQKIDTMESWLADFDIRKSIDPDFRVISKSESPSKGYIIDRVRFDRELARSAAAAGATVISSSSIASLTGSEWLINTSGSFFSVTPKFVIAADGPHSATAAIQGLKSQALLLGSQIEAPLVTKSTRTTVILSPAFRGGYAWIFPKGAVANVGLGVVEKGGGAPAQLLEKFIYALLKMNIICAGALARYSGAIPVSGLRERLIVDNVLYVGDAAGVTHPITGSGIAQAVMSGKLAGKAVANAIKENDPNLILHYDTEIRELYEGVMTHALSKRRVWEQHWDDEDFSRLCDRTWIGFKGYGKREAKNAEA